MKYYYIMPPKDKVLQRVVRIYELKKKTVVAGRFIVFPVEVKKTHTFKRTYTKTFESPESGDLPVSNPMGGIIENDNPSRADYFHQRFQSTDNVYEKVVFLNRALDYDFYNADRYIALIEYYKRMREDVEQGRLKMTQRALEKLQEQYMMLVETAQKLRPQYRDVAKSEVHAEVHAKSEVHDKSEVHASLDKSEVHAEVHAEAKSEVHKGQSCMFPILYDTDVQKRVELNTWVLSNSAKFPEFIQNTFMNAVSKTARQSSYMWDAQTETLKHVDVFPHQKFISDLLSRNSPYRGSLLYYGLGSGKTLSSINVAEGISLPTIVMLPASLHPNFEEDLRIKGYTAYHIENVWCFLNETSETTDSLRRKGFPVDNPSLMKKLRIVRENGTSGYWTIEKKQIGKRPNVWEDAPDAPNAKKRLRSDVYSDADIKSIAHTVKSIFEYKYHFIHYDGGAGIIRNLLIQSIPDYELVGEPEVLREVIPTKSQTGSTSYSKLTPMERKEYKKVVLRRMFVNGTLPNPFDGKVVIIDETHNFISMLCNASENIVVLYEMLMRSRDCRLVCLTGTPIINSPFELGILFNLLKGYTRSYTFKYDGSAVNASLIQRENPYIELCHVNSMNAEISVVMCPVGFFNVAFENPNEFGVRKYTAEFAAKSSHRDLYEKGEPSITVLENIVRKHAPSASYKGIHYHSVFPDIFQKKVGSEQFSINAKTMDEAKTDFYTTYVDIARNRINNERMFMYRSLGVVSFYNEVSVYGKDLFPKKIQGDEPDYVDLSNYQLVEYDKHRETERQMEKRSSMSEASLVQSIETKVSNVFKVFSRQRLLFVFPPHVRRPEIKDYRMKLKQKIVGKSDDVDSNCNDTASAVCTESMKNVEKDYIIATCQSIKKLTRQNLTVNEQPYNLRDLSPKYVAMLSNIESTEGLVFCYSQFRSVEGVEVFGRVLHMNGYMRYRLSAGSESRSAGSECVYEDENEDELIVGRKVRYEVRPNQFRTYTIRGFADNFSKKQGGVFLEGMDKPVNHDKLHVCRFAIWSGTETTEQRKTILETYRHLDNRYGQKLLVLMTTSSGAEGINLKYVRQVHVMEPYWNRVRVEQVIGRARRNESHVDLPPEQRNVRVYQYVSRFTKAQLDGSWIKEYSQSQAVAKTVAETVAEKSASDIILEGITQRISKIDAMKTSDETLYDITNRKYEIIRQFLDVIKGSAVDCLFNRSANVRSNPELADIKCLEHIESTDGYAYDVSSMESTMRTQAGVLEKRMDVAIYILRYRTQDGAIIHLLYESPVEDLNALEIDQPIPVFNFYSYYGIDPIQESNQVGAREPIGIIVRKRREKEDSGDTVLSLTLLDTFANATDVYERVEEAIYQTTLSIPSLKDERLLVAFRDAVNAIILPA